MRSLLKTLSESRSLPSVSIIMPTELKSFADREKIMIRLKESVVSAEKEMLQKFDSATVEPIVQKLKELVESVDTSSLTKGIGLFASSQLSRKVAFTIPVSERMLITEIFSTADIQRNIEMRSEYEVLLLSRKDSKLFSGVGEELVEIKDSDFPMRFENEFQVKRPDPHSKYQNEESKINQARVDNYYRKIAEALKRRDINIPIVLVGTIENRSDFKNTNKCPKEIIAEVNGNMTKNSVAQIRDKVLAAMKPKVE